MDRRERALRAGEQLRQLREERHLTQQEVEQRTGERFGFEQRVYAQQVSRIEKGALDKPPILDLLRYGEVLGLTRDDIAEMYDLWPRQGQHAPGAQQRLDPRLQAAIDLAEALPPEARERFLNWVEFATLQARTEQRAGSHVVGDAGTGAVTDVVKAQATQPASTPSSPTRARKTRKTGRTLIPA